MAERRTEAPVDPTRRAVSAWLWRLPVLAALAGAGFGVREAWRIHFGKAAPADPPAFEPREGVEVAALSRFTAPWDAVEFVLAGAPCVALRLPQAIPGSLEVPHVGVRQAAETAVAADAGTTDAGGPDADTTDADTTDADAAPFVLAAFSRICTHQGCLVDLNLDTEAIAFAFNHRADRPQLTCACHYSVFDPSRAGLVVSGPAVQPLPRVRLRLRTDAGPPTVLADGVERPS